MTNELIKNQGETLAQFSKWREDIGLFCKEALGFTPTFQQQELFDIVVSSKFISAKAGHGTGKSSAAAAIILWFLSMFPNSQVACTAPTKDQLRDVLWSRISGLMANMLPSLKDRLELTTTRILNKYNSASFAVAKTARAEKPDTMQGFHAKNLLMIADEASGIANPIFIPMIAALTEENNKIMLIGNPVWSTGFFADTFKQGQDWANCTMNAERSPLVTPRQLAFWRDEYGEDSDEYKIRVLGEFPSQDSAALFSLANVELAMDCEIPPDDPIVWGLDIGGFGGDDSVLAVRYGNVVKELEILAKRNTSGVANYIANRYRTTADHIKPLMIFIDVIGIGAGVYSRLLELNLPVREVIANSTATNDKRYNNRRAEFYCELRDALESRVVGLPKNQRLLDELLSIRYKYDNKGRYQLVSKQDMKSAGVKSPDMADAVAFTFCERIYGYGNSLSYSNASYYRATKYDDYLRL